MNVRENFLSIAIPDVGPIEAAELLECFRTGWISVGPKVKQFETEFAEWHGVKHAIALSSCTAALFIAAKVAGVGRGDYVIVPTMTWQSTANIVEQLEATPLFTDVERDTLLMKQDDVLRYLLEYGERVKAIIPVHYSGLPVDIDWYTEIGQRYGVKIIYDAAHAVFSEYKGKMIGGYGDMSCFSFYATKNLTTGDGGMITTNNDEFAEQCRIWSYHGLPKDSWKRYSAESASPHVQCIVPGYKFNLTDLQASLGLMQLARRKGLLDERNALFVYYQDLFKDLDAIQRPVFDTADGKWGNHLYVIKLLDETIDRDIFMKSMREFNIGTNIHFYPVHKNIYYEKKYPDVHLPNAEWLMHRIISLPFCTKYEESDLKYVYDVVKHLHEERPWEWD